MRFGFGKQVAVLTSMPINGTYDYIIPEGTEVSLGDIVEVPFKSYFKLAVVWSEGISKISPKKLKYIKNKKDDFSLTLSMMSFIDWMSEYTMQPRGLILQTVIRHFNEKYNFSSVLKLNENKLQGYNLTPQRKKIIDLMDVGLEYSKNEILKKSGTSLSVLNGLVNKEIIFLIRKNLGITAENNIIKESDLQLDLNQTEAARSLSKMLTDRFDVAVLEGVTGSGKTEVYFEPIAVALKDNLQVLVLVPEISITTQWLERFKKRFGFEPDIWHSSIKKSSRINIWNKVIKGTSRVTVGARSALFLPFKNLGLIIVDEEHDSSFKQEERIIYHARDMAIVRAKKESIPIILVSATPSIETITNVKEGRYKHFKLSSRFGGAIMPEIQMVDLLTELPVDGEWGRSWLSPPLVDAVSKKLEVKDQTFLFLNRRGYAPLSICKNCGYKLSCTSCSAWLVEHKSINKLQCHHCGFKTNAPEKCPSCLSDGKFISFGPGIERVLEEVQHRWPEARTGVIASDYYQTQSGLADFIRSIENKKLDIIIGTQLLAKGHHFPNLTLVGIVDADLGLSSWDLRGSEKVYQMMYQVSGRAGRGKKAGKVILQSHESSNYIFKALSKNESSLFLDKEIEDRKNLEMPPFGRLISLILSGKNEDVVISYANMMNKNKPIANNIEILGPAPAVMSKLRGHYRYRFLVKGPRNVLLQPFVQRWIELSEVSSLVKVQIDVDPYSFY